MMRIGTPFVVALLVLLTACGGKEWQPPKKKSAPARDDRPLTQPDGAPSLGSETDPSRRDAVGQGVISTDTYLLRRRTDRLNYARVKLSSSPSQGDQDTFEKRVQEGRYIPIPQGTKVRRFRRNEVSIDGRVHGFVRVEVTDGSIEDENGDPAQGSVYEAHYSGS